MWNKSSLFCLTQSTPSVSLSVCDRTNPSQQWQQAEENINPIIHETHPKLTLDDVKLSKKEFTENPISVTDTNINITGVNYTRNTTTQNTASQLKDSSHPSQWRRASP